MSEFTISAVLIIGLLYAIFPFAVWSYLGRISKDLRKCQDRLDTISRATIETSQHTRQLRDFFDGRNVELRRE